MCPDIQWAELVSRISKELFHMKLSLGHPPPQGGMFYETLECLCTFLAATNWLSFFSLHSASTFSVYKLATWKSCLVLSFQLFALVAKSVFVAQIVPAICQQQFLVLWDHLPAIPTPPTSVPGAMLPVHYYKWLFNWERRRKGAN